jgi:hypothetical protein
MSDKAVITVHETNGGWLRIASASSDVRFTNPGNLYLRSGFVPSGSSPTALSGEFGGNIILETGSDRRECVRFSPDGKVYVRGELVEENKQIWEAFKAWLVSSSTLWGSPGSPDFVVSKE